MEERKLHSNHFVINCETIPVRLSSLRVSQNRNENRSRRWCNRKHWCFRRLSSPSIRAQCLSHRSQPEFSGQACQVPRLKQGHHICWSRCPVWYGGWDCRGPGPSWQATSIPACVLKRCAFFPAPFFLLAYWRLCDQLVASIPPHLFKKLPRPNFAGTWTFRSKRTSVSHCLQ